MLSTCTRQTEFLGFQNGRFLQRINSSTARRAGVRLSGLYKSLCVADVEFARNLALNQFKQSLAAWQGHCRWANSASLNTALGKKGGWLFNELAQTGAKIVMKNNAPVSIIMSPKEYERMVDENENLELLLLARDRLEKNVKGSTCSIDDAMRHFGIRESDIEMAEDSELS